MTKFKRVMFLIICVSMICGLGLNTIKASAETGEPVNLSDNISAHLRLERGKTVVDFIDSFSKVNSFAIGDYDMYGILDENNQVRYYIADIFENNDYIQSKESSKVLKVMIYNKDLLVFDPNKPITLEITYYNNVDNNVFIIEKELFRADFSLLTRFAITHHLGDDEISDRLRASMNAESSFRSSGLKRNDLNQIGLLGMQLNTIGYTTYYSNMNRTVGTYVHDSYTSSDYTIENYIESFFNANLSGSGIYTDDYITRMIPKYLFFTPGVHSYVGKEYGFSLKVTSSGNDLYIADAFIYDIEVTIPTQYYESLHEASATVTPLFQFRYNAKKKGTMSDTEWRKTFSAGLTEVVYKHTNYDAPNYYLKDVQMKFTAVNHTNPNPGDADYNPYDDYGDNVYSTQYAYNGEGKLTGRDNYNLSSYQVGFDTHSSYDAETNNPYLSGNIVMTNSYGSLVLSEGGTNSPTNKVITHTALNNRATSLYYYDMILRSVTLNRRYVAVANNQDPLLIGTRTSNNFIKGTVVYESRSSSQSYVESQLHLSICVDFVSDDTYYSLVFFPKGQVNVLDTAEGSYYYGNYSRSAKHMNTMGGEHQYNFTISKADQSIYISFVPAETGYYVIETLGTMDTVMELRDSYTGQFLETNDDGGTNYNSKIIIYGIQNHPYTIRVKLYNKYLTGSFGVRLNYHPTVTVDSPGYSMFYTNNPQTTIKIYIPEESLYEFTAVSNKFSTQIMLFTLEGEFIDFSPDHPYYPGTNGVIRAYIPAGYYLVTVLVGPFYPNDYCGLYYYDVWK